jgi:hypothetical protein
VAGRYRLFAMAMARLYGDRLSGRPSAKAIGLCFPAGYRRTLSVVIARLSFLRRHRTIKTHDHRSNAGCLGLEILILRRQQAGFVQLVQLILELVRGAEQNLRAARELVVGVESASFDDVKTDRVRRPRDLIADSGLIDGR